MKIHSHIQRDFLSDLDFEKTPLRSYNSCLITILFAKSSYILCLDYEIRSHRIESSCGYFICEYPDPRLPTTE